MTGVSGSSAVRMSVTASNSLYSTATLSAASSATARLVATTAATASPCQQTRPMAIARWDADLSPFKCESTPTQGVMTEASSSPVTIAMTPGMALAALASIPTIFAWACGERTNATCPIRGSSMSLT